MRSLLTCVLPEALKFLDSLRLLVDFPGLFFNFKIFVTMDGSLKLNVVGQFLVLVFHSEDCLLSLVPDANLFEPVFMQELRRILRESIEGLPCLLIVAHPLNEQFNTVSVFNSCSYSGLNVTYVRFIYLLFYY